MKGTSTPNSFLSWLEQSLSECNLTRQIYIQKSYAIIYRPAV